MKKIISALAVGAMAVGFATADLSINANTKMSGWWYRYNSKNLGGSNLKQKELFNLGDHAANENVTLKASGNIFTFTTVLTPYNTDKNNNDIMFKAMTIAAKVEDFTFTTGWHRDGIKVYDVNGNISAIDEGRLTGAAYKLGSAFSGSNARFVNNQAAIGKDQTSYFVHGKYALPVSDVFTLNIAASAMSPHGIKKSSSEDDYSDNTAYGGKGDKRKNDSIAWGVFVNPVVKKIVGFDLVAKGWKNSAKADDNYNQLLGGYANLLCVPFMNTALFGGSVYLVDGDLEEWNVDLSLGLRLGEGNRVMLTFNNKFAFKDGGDTVDNYPGWSTKYTNEYILYNVLGASFQLNDTLKLIGTVGHQSVFGDGAEKGTSLFVYPHAQVFASSTASVSAGAVLTLDKLGYKKDGVTGDDKKMAVLVNVPVVVRIQL